MFSTYRCQNPTCAHTWEGIVAICARCGSIGAKVSGIEQCLSSGRPPGYAGGKTTPHSARSYDRAMTENFKRLKISNVTHKEVNGQLIPDVTFSNRPNMVYDSAPNPNPGQRSFPIRAYTNMSQMAKDLSPFGVSNIPFTIDGKSWAPPQEHPEVKIGGALGGGNTRNFLRDRTTIVARHREK